MSEPTGKVFGLFDNGKAQWVRWLVAMAIGAGVTYASTQSRLAVLENRMTSHESIMASLAGDMREDMRELRTAIYAGQSKSYQTIIEDELPPSSRRRSADKLPVFPDKFSAVP